MHRLSVVIPTLNRAELLATTIDLIQRQTVHRDLYEVLVIDNNSTDHTQTVLAQKARTYRNLKYFFQRKPGAAATRNVGIREATGDIVLFIDDDIFADPGLIESHLKYHEQNPGASIVGTIVSPWDDSTDPFLRYLRDRRIFNPYSIACGRPMDFSYYHTGNVSTSLKQLCDVGGFNEEFHVYGMEDIELGYRLQKRGCRMTPGVLARAHHEYFPTYDFFIERCRQAGYSLGKMIELHPELRRRFTENGKGTALLKHFHVFYRMLMAASDPLCKGLVRWEKQRGASAVTSVLDQHYYWAIRYRYFLGYRDYIRLAERGARVIPASHPAYPVLPKLAIGRQD